MAIERLSRKLNHASSQTRFTSGKYVLLRVVHFETDCTVMTAVAPDDDGQNSPFPDNDRLMAAAMRVFAPLASEMAERRDAQKQRPYVEFYQVPLSVRKNAAEELARELGLETIEEQAREEGREIYHALGGAVNDWEDAIYQGDGMWLTDDGDWVQR